MIWCVGINIDAQYSSGQTDVVLPKKSFAWQIQTASEQKNLYYYGNPNYSRKVTKLRPHFDRDTNIL